MTPELGLNWSQAIGFIIPAINIISSFWSSVDFIFIKQSENQKEESDSGYLVKAFHFF